MTWDNNWYRVVADCTSDGLSRHVFEMIFFYNDFGDVFVTPRMSIGNMGEDFPYEDSERCAF